MAALWQRLGRAASLADQRKGRPLACAVARALGAMVANRAWAPGATLSWAEPWRRADVRLAGPDTLALGQRERAMALRAAHKDGRAHARSCRRAALLQCDVALLGYAPPSWPLASDEME